MILRVTFYDNVYTELLEAFFRQKQMVIPTFYIPNYEISENNYLELENALETIFGGFKVNKANLIVKDKEFEQLCNDILYNNLYYNKERYNRLIQLFKEKFFLFLNRNVELLADFCKAQRRTKLRDLDNLLEVTIVPSIFSCEERNEIIYYFYNNDKYIKQ